MARTSGPVPSVGAPRPIVALKDGILYSPVRKLRPEQVKAIVTSLRSGRTRIGRLSDRRCRDYLSSGGHIKAVSLGGGYSITPFGVDAVEKVRRAS